MLTFAENNMIMDNAEFWNSINRIIDNGFTSEGLLQLDDYAEQFISQKLVYQRFSPQEQHGCSEGGATNVVASLLAAAKTGTNKRAQEEFTDFKEETKCAAQQANCIEQWARAVNCWTDDVTNILSKNLGNEIAQGGEAKVYDHGSSLIKSIGLDYYIQPILALDRISLHNTLFPETKLYVLGFGRDSIGDFQIIVEQPFIIGNHASEYEIESYAKQLGFELRNPVNWTYANDDIYLSDLHDENVIKSIRGNIFVIDCDVRINVPCLRQKGNRIYSKIVKFL